MKPWQEMARRKCQGELCLGRGGTGLLMVSWLHLPASPSLPHRCGTSLSLPKLLQCPVEGEEQLWRAQELELLTLDFFEEQCPPQRAFLPVLLFPKARSKLPWPKVGMSGNRLPPLTPRVQTQCLLPDLSTWDISPRRGQVQTRMSDKLPLREPTCSWQAQERG